MAEKVLYRVSGWLNGQEWVEEFTRAYSESQAIKQVAARLAKSFNLRVFINDVSATKVVAEEIKKKRQIPEQLSFLLDPPVLR